MAGTGTKRITELTEASTIQNGDFIAVDSNARGTKKVSTDTLATSAALTAETNARAGADEQMSERMDGIEEQTALIQNPTKTLSGALCSFTDGADMPMVACTAEIVPKQSGTGTPSPDNVRPISGWESVSVNVSGKNLLNMTDVLPNGSYNGDVFTCSNYSARPLVALFDNPQTVTFSYMSGDYTGTGARLEFLNGSTVLTTKGVSSASPTSETVQNVTGVRFNYGSQGTLTLAKPQVEVGNTATTYEPYTGTTTPVNLGRTVYGGTLDVVSGSLTVDRAMVDLNSLSYERITNGSVYIFQTYIAGKKYPSTTTDFITSCYEVQNTSGFGLSNKRCTTGTGSSAFYFRDDDYTDAASFKASLSGQTLVYHLMTPQTYQLTPTQINTLLGENNVWADAGAVSITYRRDISIVINNLESALNV